MHKTGNKTERERGKAKARANEGMPRVLKKREVKAPPTGTIPFYVASVDVYLGLGAVTHLQKVVY